MSPKTNKELESEIDQIVEGAPSYSWIDEYTESRIPTLRTRRRPARKKARKKATKDKRTSLKPRAKESLGSARNAQDRAWTPRRPTILLQDPTIAVTNAVRTMPGRGRFGRGVFIWAIWNRIGKKIGMTLPALKRWLVDQNRLGNLTLARADLVDAMDPILVEESEIQDLGATFHFVLDKSSK